MNSPMLIGDGLRRNAWKFPVKIAAKDRVREISYADLNTRVNRLANSLLSIGVKRGDAVALSVGNRIEHLEIIFATAKIGALAIPLDIKWKALEIGSVLSALEPKFIILEEDCAQEFEKAKRLKDLHFIKSILFSSDLTYGGLMILHERFDAEDVLKAIEKEKVTYIGGVPTMCERMLHVLESRKYDTSS